MLSGSVFQSRFARRAMVLSSLWLAPAVSGCGKPAEPWDKVYPVRGAVSFNGKPVANAEIALHPEDDSFPDSVRPRARTSEDGEFVVWTYQQGDGAPAGTYKATVVHNDVAEVNGILVTKPNDLPAKYSRLQTTDLTIEVAEEPNEIPEFELK